MNTYYIYKYVQNNKIMYIGQTVDLKRRINEHKIESKFQKLNNYNIYYFKCNNKKEMDSFEYFLITKYHPPLNITYNNPEHYNIIAEPEWKLYQEENFNKENNNNIKNKTITNKREEKELRPKAILDNLFVINNTPISKTYFSGISLLEQKQLVYLFCKSKLNNNNYNIPFHVKEWVAFMNVSSATNDYYMSFMRSPFVQKSLENNHNYFLTKRGKEAFNSKLYNLSTQSIAALNQATSKYTIAILELILNIGENSISIKELFNLFGYNQFRDLRRRVLEKALPELQKIGYNYDYEKIMEGRKVDSIKFIKNTFN